MNFFMNNLIGGLGWKNIQENNINQTYKNTVLVMLCMGATFVKKKLCLVGRIVLFDIQVCIYLLSVFYSHNLLKILSWISVTWSHINDLNDVIVIPSN